MLMDELDALFAYWAKFPPVHEAVRYGLIAWGIIKPPRDDSPGTKITAQDIAEADRLFQEWGAA